MSRGVPYYSCEWLDAYNKRLAASKNRAQKPPVARPAEGRALVPYSPTESVVVPFRAAGGKQTKPGSKEKPEDWKSNQQGETK